MIPLRDENHHAASDLLFLANYQDQCKVVFAHLDALSDIKRRSLF